MRHGRDGEGGYALVAAVASIAVFALIALTAIEATRGAVVAASGDVGRARASAAADAGVAIAIHDLLNDDPASRAAIDGRGRVQRFGDATLLIRVEDERGKVPLNALEDEEVGSVFAHLGLSGDRLAIARDSFRDWTDDDDDPLPHGAEADYYQARGIRPRNGRLESIGETILIRGFDAALVARLQSVATLHFGKGSFDPSHASPLAIAVMMGEEAGAIDILARQREQAGQRTALEIGEEQGLVGRPLTIVVDASLADGSRAHRRELVELTGLRDQPFVVRERD